MFGFVFLLFQVVWAEETSQFDNAVKLLREGQASEAEIILQDIANKEPKNASVWWELGWSHWAQDDFQGAIDSWNKVEQLEPNWNQLKKWQKEAIIRQSYNASIYVADEIIMEPTGGKHDLCRVY